MSRNYQSEQLEQLQRMLENPKQQSGLYLIDTDLSDEDIEALLKKTRLCRYVKENLFSTTKGDIFELLVVGLSHQCNDGSIESLREKLLTADWQSREIILYSLLIQILKHLCQNEKSVIHIQGGIDLSTLQLEDLCKFDAALTHHNEIIFVISKQKNMARPRGNAIIKIQSLKGNIVNGLMENRLNKVHISYKHDDEYETALSAIKAGLNKNDILFSIDDYDIKYGDNIDEYEREIGAADKVIMFIIPKYFESLDCMFEMTQMFKNGEIQSRIYPVVDMKDIPRNGDGLKKVEDYWKQERNKKAKQISTSSGSACVYLTKEITKINDIINTLNDFWEFICRYSTGKFEELIANDAALLMQKLKETFQKVTACIDEKFVPLEETKPTDSRVVIQNGEKSLYIGNNTGDITIN